MKAHGVHARDHIVAQIRRLEPLLGEVGDHSFHLRIDFEKARRIAIPLAEAGGQWPVAEAIDFLQERAVSAAGEARRLLIHGAERDQLGRFEFRSEICFARLALLLREAARHANDFQAPVLEVVRLLGVQRENAIRERLVGRDERSDLLQAKHFRCREPMPPVRRPQPALFTAHDDQRVEKRSGLIDLGGQPLHVGGRQIALKRRGLHGRERNRREHHGSAAERVPIRANRCAAGLHDQGSEIRHLGRIRCERHIRR